ncbi:Druantia anti-phage system protein DruA [Bdellovibrionota bacterium FG-1]
MRYRGREFSDAEIVSIKGILAANGTLGRVKLSCLICEALNWRRRDGRLKDMACRVALLQMERDGVVTLPPGKRACGVIRSIPAHTLIGDPGAEMSCRAGDLRDIRLELVQSPADKRLWAELVDRYHYLGYTPLGGAQLRYLIRSEDRVLGCLGFSAAAWKTAPRDQFIGWSVTQREQSLEKVVNNARFLILPWVKVHSLASKALSMAARRLADDWFTRYGYRPVLLETFVEKERFAGTCYKAANWIQVGQTQGRGRYDSTHQSVQPIKTIWLYPLTPTFRKELCS